MSAPPSTAAPRPGRQRLPQSVYWRRRLIVLAALGLIGWAGVTALSGLVGGDDSEIAVGASSADDAADADDLAAAETLPATTIPDGAGVDGAAAPAGDAAIADGGDGELSAEALVDPGETDGTDGTDTDEPQPATQSDPAVVHIVGDSDAGTFGPYLQTLLDNTLIVDTSLDYKVSSGLARPDFFNWPEQLRTTIPDVDPDIVVVTFGGNDSQGLSKPQAELEFLVGDPLANEAEWSAEYERRVLEIIDILLEDGREVVWVGSPNDDNPDVTAKLRIQDQAVRAAIAQRPEVVFVDTWTRFSGRDGNWAEFVVDPRDGVGKDVRADDGYHLNVTGAEILAIDIAVEIRDLLRADGANI